MKIGLPYFPITDCDLEIINSQKVTGGHSEHKSDNQYVIIMLRQKGESSMVKLLRQSDILSTYMHVKRDHCVYSFLSLINTFL